MSISVISERIIPIIPQLPTEGKTLLSALEVVKLAIEVVKGIGNAIIGLAKELGIIPDMEVEELGARAIQAMEKGICPENFASAEEWVNKLLQDDWGYSPEESKNLSQNEKVYVGIGAVAACLIDKYEQLPVKEFLLQAPSNIGLFTGEHMQGIADIMRNDSGTFGAIVQYLSGSDKSRQTVETATDALISIEKAIDPDLNDNEAYEKVISYHR